MNDIYAQKISTRGIPKYLKERNIVQSMSRKGNSTDNEATENFFGKLKAEIFYGEKFSPVEIFIQNFILTYFIATTREFSAN